MEYFLDGTRESIGFDRVLSLINPQSCYGKVQKGKLQPFLPEQEAALREEFAKIKECAGRLEEADPYQWPKMQSAFATIPNIAEEIGLVKGRLVLNEINLFTIKKFLCLSFSLSHLLHDAQLVPEQHANLLPPDELQREYINKNTGYQFYLGDYGGEDYHQLQKEIKELVVFLTETSKKEIYQTEQDLNCESGYFNGNYLYVSKNDQGLMAKALESPRLERYQDFGTEICFVRKTASTEEEIEAAIKKKKQDVEILEGEIRRKLTDLIRKHLSYFDQAQEVIGYCDLLLAKALFMRRFDCIIPRIGEGRTILLNDGININIKKELEEVHKEFTPIRMYFDHQSIVITGANMGGKTVTLKTLGLLVAMAQHGIPVPAQYFSFPLFHFLFCAGEFKEKTGLSSFATEIERLKVILGRIEEKGLVLLDEPARSTNPQEGLAIVGAFLKKMAQGYPICLVITHFEGLARMVGAEHWQVRGVKSVESLLQQEDLEKYFDYRLEKVEIDKQVPRDAIKVAELLGLEKEVLVEAKSLFREIVKGGPK